MARELQRKFRFLMITVQRSLQDEDIEYLKLIMTSLLQDISDITIPHLVPVINQISKIKSINQLFNFLLHRRYMSYFNYNLLCEFADVASNRSVQNAVEEYKRMYAKFIEEPTFAELMEIFQKHPDLDPTTVVGLPTIVVIIARESCESKYKQWEKEGWGKYVKSKLPMLNGVNESSIVLTYAIFPTDLCGIMNDLQSPQAQEYFQEIGATIEIPEATQEVIRLLSKV